MTKYKQALCALFLALFSSITFAQSNGASPNTNSPYTRYGFGQLSDQSFGNSKAMGGIAYGLRDGAQINVSNPASYTAIDSLTFIFDGGFSMQNTNFSDGNVKMNVKNSSFDYVAMQFRLNRRFAMSAGFIPFSTVGYSFQTQAPVENAESITAYSDFTGTGGLNQLFLGAGFKVIDNLSIGANVSYLFGTIKHQSITSFSDNTINSSVRLSQVKVNDFKLDFGVQYTQQFGKKHAMTLGAVYSLKHKLNNDAFHMTGHQSNSNIWGQNVDTINNGFQLPHSFGAGLTYVYDKRLTVGFDYTLQKWGETRFFNEYGKLNDRSKYSFGAEFIPSYTKRNYLTKIKYRVGAYYSDPYVKVKGLDGAREFGVSAGFGLPIINSKSLLNISAQYINVKPKTKGLLEEKYMKISVGLTFSERWFAKWKVQ